ncbi:hypothetical protein K435DRAFT_867448 [Dendrothele bispora CBS 962.96]|uniref:Uncharacterized protein n=1 Tax=Dendrothele bispora (strain CBS 962.96) TaxID=1314807 RepID=A0A4S8LEB4_DENBC|nr:hypothetical protein K435DRAFT_867448 [Dendrothele bispora CBS 962.96]
MKGFKEKEKHFTEVFDEDRLKELLQEDSVLGQCMLLKSNYFDTAEESQLSIVNNFVSLTKDLSDAQFILDISIDQG